MTIIASLLRAADLPDSPTARLDVELLLAAALGKSRSYLHTWPEKIVSSEAALTFADYLQRRRAGEPVAYILGQQGFWKLDLEVAPPHADPRARTPNCWSRRPWNCCPPRRPRCSTSAPGSGAIALALASERPAWYVTAVDRVLEAVALAERNRQRLNLHNATVLNSHWFSALQGHTYDLIISNPPYIAANDPHLAAGDVRFEPASALVAGHDGLDDLRLIIAEAPAHPQRGRFGCCWSTVTTRPAAVRDLLLSQGFEGVHSRIDLGGHERISLGHRPC